MKLHGHALKTLMLIGSQAVGLTCLVANQAIIKRVAGVEALGHYAFLIGLFTLGALFFEMGWGPTVARQAALCQSKEDEINIARASARFMLLPLVLQAFSIAIASVVLSVLVSPALLVPCLIAAIISMGFPLQITLRDYHQGKHDIYGLAILYASPPILQLIFICGLAWTGHLTLSTGVWAYCGALALVCGAMLIRAGAWGKVSKENKEELSKAREQYGRGIWVGRQIAMGGYILDTPLLGLLATPTAVAHYAITKAICNPLGMVFGMTAQPLFKSMVTRQYIPRAWQLLIWGGALFGGALLAIVSPYIVWTLYGLPPMEMRHLLLLQCLTSACAGISPLYNQFLGAQGKGKILKYGGLAVGVLTLGANLIFIPMWGALGAGLAALCSCSFWVAYCFYWYKKVENSSKEVLFHVPCTGETP